MARVTIDQGILVGNKCKTENGLEYMEFLQIPYAKPPVGNLRFKCPQPPEPWIGERNALTIEDKHVCYQFDRFKNCVKGSEDCLYLNVYTPQLRTEYQKPYSVLVYIHGGAFMVGSGTDKRLSGPEFLIENNVVIVAINYRLGVFGFLSLEIPEASGNMGLKDQVMALRWVQKNINSFGGDKDNVTVFGISAGSASIEYLVISPVTNGLFHKAIMQSGSTLNHWAVNHVIKERSIKLALELGFKGATDDCYKIYKFLLNQSTEALGVASIKLFTEINSRGTNFGFTPCIEKDFGDGKSIITSNAYDILNEGKFNKVPVLRGFCEFEGLLAFALSPKNIQKLVEDKDFTEYWTYTLSAAEKEEYNKKIGKVYLTERSHDDDKEQFAIDFFGDYDLSSGIWIGSKLIAKTEIPVYAYMFAYDGGLNYVKNAMFNIKHKGACHADDTAYIINVNSGLLPSKSDLEVRNRLVQLWTNFAKTGNPTPCTSDLIPVLWPRFTCDQQLYLKIDKELTIEAKYQSDRIAVFEEIYRKYKV